MLGGGLALSTRFPHLDLPDRTVHRLPSWKNGAFALAKEFMFRSGGNEENFSPVFVSEMSFLKSGKFSLALL